MSRWTPEALGPNFRCQHPRTAENTVVVRIAATLSRPARDVRRCKECNRARNKKGYAQRMRRGVVRPEQAFCVRCLSGACGTWHQRDHVDARCRRSVGAEQDWCLCGAAWSLTWPQAIAPEAFVAKRKKAAPAAQSDWNFERFIMPSRGRC